MEIDHGRRSGRLISAKKMRKNKHLKAGDGVEEKFAFTLHPLFFAFGVYYALTGRLGVFIVYTLSALLHEFGHAQVALNAGFTLKALSLMPYGASVTADLEGISFKDEVAVLVAGPLINLLVAIICVASWWLFPSAYPFTEVVFTANLSLFIINLFPIGTLDGGRILKSFFKEYFSEKTAEVLTKTLGVILSAFLLTCFILDCITAKNISKVNFSLLFFSSFALVGVFGSKKRNIYIKRLVGVGSDALKNGVIVKRIAVTSKTKIKRVTALMDANCYNEIFITDLNITISQNALISGLSLCDYYSTVGENLRIFIDDKVGLGT